MSHEIGSSLTLNEYLASPWVSMCGFDTQGGAVVQWTCTMAVRLRGCLVPSMRHRGLGSGHMPGLVSSSPAGTGQGGEMIPAPYVRDSVLSLFEVPQHHSPLDQAEALLSAI